MNTSRNRRAAFLAAGIVLAAVAVLAMRRPTRADAPPAAAAVVAQRWEYATYEVETSNNSTLHTWNDGTRMTYKPTLDELYQALAGAPPPRGAWLSAILNLVGKSGWELVTIDVEKTNSSSRRAYIFKRAAR
jgi:hypothetical protein